MTDANRVENARRELQRAEAALAAARALAQLGLWDDAVSRAYYAAFHAAKAALFSAGVQARTHEGTHDLLFQHFVATGALRRQVAKGLAALQRYREQADYSTTVRFDAESGAEEIDRAAGIVGEITDLLRARGVLA
ncbi:MAG TPA: HEPN domain-containing protein [Polyangia bacterium]